MGSCIALNVLFLRGSRKFCQCGSNSTLTTLSIADEGRKDPNNTKDVQSLVCQQKANKMAFCWQADNGPKLNAHMAAL